MDELLARGGELSDRREARGLSREARAVVTGILPRVPVSVSPPAPPPLP